MNLFVLQSLEHRILYFICSFMQYLISYSHFFKSICTWGNASSVNSLRPKVFIFRHQRWTHFLNVKSELGYKQRIDNNCNSQNACIEELFLFLPSLPRATGTAIPIKQPASAS